MIPDNTEASAPSELESRPRRPVGPPTDPRTIVEPARKLLEQMLELGGYAVSVQGRADARSVFLSVHGDDAESLVSRPGGTASPYILDAYSLLLRRALFRFERDAIPIIIDAADYRLRRVEALRSVADLLADKAVDGMSIEVFGMNSVDRRAVHRHISGDHPEVGTLSVGAGPFRRLTVKQGAREAAR